MDIYLVFIKWTMSKGFTSTLTYLIGFFFLNQIKVVVQLHLWQRGVILQMKIPCQGQLNLLIKLHSIDDLFWEGGWGITSIDRNHKDLHKESGAPVEWLSPCSSLEIRFCHHEKKHTDRLDLWQMTSCKFCWEIEAMIGRCCVALLVVPSFPAVSMTCMKVSEPCSLLQHPLWITGHTQNRFLTETLAYEQENSSTTILGC